MDTDPNSSTKALAQEFYALFQSSRSKITEQLDGLLKSMPTADALQPVSQEIAQLRKRLVDSTDLLPAYDQRQCEAQMTTLETHLEGIRSSATAKPKFSFQRKTNKPSSSAVGDTIKSGTPTPHVPATEPASTFYTLHKHAHRYLTSASLPPPTSGQPQSDLTISDLDHCIVNLCSSTSQNQLDSEQPWSHALTALHIWNLRATIVLLPNISGSILLHDLEGCIIVSSCHQFRMHTSKDVAVYLNIPSSPIIEHCSRISFSAYPSFIDPSLPLEEVSRSNHANVLDFSHIITSTPSPNWSLLPELKQISKDGWTGLMAFGGGEGNVGELLSRYNIKN